MNHLGGTLTIVSGAVLAALLAAPAAVAEPLALGGKAPKAGVMMKSVDGAQVSIASAAGKSGTLVIFSCNACPWVKAWEDRIARIGNDALAEGFGVVAINSNDPAQVAEDGYEEMQRRARERGFKFPYVVDATSEVAAAFGATRTPEVFLFDRAGVLVYHGAIDDNAKEPEKVQERYLENALQALLAGREIDPKQTKALGCTIKFRSNA